MAVPFARELEILFRVCQAGRQTVRESLLAPHRGDVVAMGADGSPTEELDRRAEARILAVLEEEGVDWDVVSEEAGHVVRGGGRTLVLDPIDGSHNVLRNLPYASISIALGASTLGGVDVGVVHDLFTGTTAWATRGGGACVDGRRVRVRPWNPKGELFFLNLGRHATPRALALAGRGRRVRALGCASIEMVTVATGAADAYLFENDTPNRNLRVTDIAAAYRIVLEAGGGVGDATGRPIDAIPLELGHHTSVLAWGDPALAASFAEGGTP